MIVSQVGIINGGMKGALDHGFYYSYNILKLMAINHDQPLILKQYEMSVLVHVAY